MIKKINKLFFNVFILIFTCTNLHATEQEIESKSNIILQHINNVQQYNSFKNEMLNKVYHKPLNENEEETVKGVLNGIELMFESSTLQEEQLKVYHEKLEDSLKKFPIYGHWIIRNKNGWEPMGQISLYFSKNNGQSTIYINILDRYQSGGVGTEACQELCTIILPYIGRKVETVELQTLWERALTQEEKGLPFAQRKKIFREIPTYQKMRIETGIFQGTAAVISPYDNFGSLISQVRSGASPAAYQKNHIQFSYPKTDASEIISQYPLIEELREIANEIENKDTRLQGINNYRLFFEKI